MMKKCLVYTCTRCYHNTPFRTLYVVIRNYKPVHLPQPLSTNKSCFIITEILLIRKCIRNERVQINEVTTVHSGIVSRPGAVQPH